MADLSQNGLTTQSPPHDCSQIVCRSGAAKRNDPPPPCLRLNTGKLASALGWHRDDAHAIASGGQRNGP